MTLKEQRDKFVKRISVGPGLLPFGYVIGVFDEVMGFVHTAIPESYSPVPDTLPMTDAVGVEAVTEFDPDKWVKEQNVEVRKRKPVDKTADMTLDVEQENADVFETLAKGPTIIERD